MDFTKEINGHTLEYLDDGHLYLVDGVIVPSITQMLRMKFGNKYRHVNEHVLQRASERGTAVHEAIEMWCRNGTESDLPELRHFKFLKMKYGFQVIDNEVPVILFDGDEPISAGRLDLVIQLESDTGLADIKRTSVLDKEYLFYQLNLYRIAYQQCYGTEIKFLRGVHLREDVRKFVQIPINEEMTEEYIRTWRKNAVKILG